MNDNDIIKNLEICESQEGCEDCPLYDGTGDICQLNTRAVLQFIYRLKAEIERLKKHNAKMAYKHYCDGIKEFVERLSEEAHYSEDFGEIAVACYDIDNLMKEMTK